MRPKKSNVKYLGELQEIWKGRKNQNILVQTQENCWSKRRKDESSTDPVVGSLVVQIVEGGRLKVFFGKSFPNVGGWGG